MPEMTKEEYEAREKEYQEFLDGMQEKGFKVENADDLANMPPMLQPPEVRHTNASLLASINNAKEIYEKRESLKGIVLDLMYRTRFESFEQLVAFNEYVEWCEEFGTGYDVPLRYLAGMPAIGGKSREEYLDAISYRPRLNFRGNNGGGPSPKYKEGELT